MDTSTHSPKRKPRKVLTLAERIKVLERQEKGETCSRIAESVGVGKTQIQSIINKKEELKEMWERGDSAGRKLMKRRKCVYEAINGELFEWFCQMRRGNTPISGSFFKEKAHMLSVKHGCPQFALNVCFILNK